MENVDKWRIRQKKAEDITVSSKGGIEGASWDLIKKWQDEFQREFCSSCINFDPDKNDFKKKGHVNNPADCNFHYTDIVGQCWNYKNREVAESEAAAFAQLEKPEASPIIELPPNTQLQIKLQQKLQEYKLRLDPYKAPELQCDTIYKIAVLSKLLEEGKVTTWELSQNLAEIYGELDILTFQNACVVIDDYCKTGGANTQGGTGLPK